MRWSCEPLTEHNQFPAVCFALSGTIHFLAISRSAFIRKGQQYPLVNAWVRCLPRDLDHYWPLSAFEGEKAVNLSTRVYRTSDEYVVLLYYTKRTRHARLCSITCSESVLCCCCYCWEVRGDKSSQNIHQVMKTKEREKSPIIRSGRSSSTSWMDLGLVFGLMLGYLTILATCTYYLLPDDGFMCHWLVWMHTQS